MPSVSLLHLDSQFLVCLKPVGLDSEHRLPDELKQAVGGDIYPLHRLDTNVGGVMVFARTQRAAAELSAAIARGDMVKEYRAMVHGTPPESGVWEDLLWKDSRQNKVFVVRRMRKGVRQAKLSFTRLSSGPTSAVHIRLYTGRSHQIRVQFASRGFPLVGDHKYGARDRTDLPMLWCCRIRFPWHGEMLQFTSMPDWCPEV